MLFILDIARDTNRFSASVRECALEVSLLLIVTRGGAAMLRAWRWRFGRGSFSLMGTSVPDMFAAFLTMRNCVSLAQF